MRCISSEFDLYEPMRAWLQGHLEDSYRRKGCEVITLDSHARYLDAILAEYDAIDYYPQAVGLQIQIDVLGIVRGRNNVDLAFIEAKKTALNLHDLGQLWAYCKLCDPAEAFLLSPAGLGSLKKVLVNLRREDLLDFGTGRTIKKMQVAKWDTDRCCIDSFSLIPKL